VLIFLIKENQTGLNHFLLKVRINSNMFKPSTESAQENIRTTIQSFLLKVRINSNMSKPSTEGAQVLAKSVAFC